MHNRLLAVLTGVVMVASAIVALPAVAQQAPSVPAEPNIVDPKGDANFLNSGTAAPLGQDTTTPADASAIGDLLAVWFSHTANEVSIHWQTEAAPPGGNGVGYQAFVSPGEGTAGSSTTGCLRFVLNIPGSNPGGGTYQDKPWVRLLDRCNVGTSVFTHAIDGTHTINEGPDKTGIMTATFPRSYSPLLADGKSLTTPTAAAHSPLVGTHQAAYASPSTDNTKPGSDYLLAPAGSGSEDPEAEPPGKNDPPGNGKKKGCGKGKGKQKGACPGKKSPKPEGPTGSSCAPYQPGEMGAEAETTLVTAAATEEKPIEMEFTFGRAMGSYAPAPVDTSVHVLHNVQVDAAAAEAGLWVKLESPVTDDPDLYAYWNTGKEAARAAGFNQALAAGPLPLGLFSGTGNGGHSGFGYEQLDGIRTPDCAGFTLDLVNWLGQGGKYKLKLWLGEIKNDPKPPASEQRATASLYEFLMSF